MPTIDYTFTTPANYTFDANLIEVVGGAAQLKVESLAGKVFSQDFANDTGFTYDNTKAEFVAGVVQQKDITPTNSITGVIFDVDAPVIAGEANLNWHKSGGSLVATSNGAPLILAGKLVCVGSNGVYYQRASNTIETHKFIYTPNYTTAPPSNVNLFTCSNDTNDNDRFLLTHSPSGNTLRLTLADNAGAAVIATATALGAAWTPVLGHDYEFEIVIDSVAGLVRVFIDGQLHGTNTPGAWARNIGALNYYLGAAPEIYNTAAGSFGDYISFDDAQHSADYVAGYSISKSIYPFSIVDAPPLTHVGPGGIESLDIFASTQIGTAQYTLSIGGPNTPLYWDGSIWMLSDGSYAQSNDVATINANISTVPGVSGTTTVHVDIMFDDVNTISSVDFLSITHTGGNGFSVNNPSIVPLSGFNQDTISQFLIVAVNVGMDDVQFIMRIDSVDKYFDGTTWTNSDGTYTQSNSIAVVQANISSLNIVGLLLPVALLHSNDGTTTPQLDNISVTYSFFGGAALTENTCVVWGYVYDENNAPSASVEIKVTPTEFGFINNKVINRTELTVNTNATGYWEIELIETQTSGNQWAYKFVFPGYETVRAIPDKSSESFNNLLSPP